MTLLGERVRVTLFAALITLAALAAWSNSFDASFHFDDHPSVEDNTALAKLSNLGEILKTQPRTSTLGRPLANLSFAVNRALTGPGVRGYHMVNLALHILAALALFGLLRRTLRSPALAGAYGEDADLAAFAVALLWALHPLQTAAVTYIVQRVEVLASLFYLFTLYAFARSLEGGAREGRWRVLAVASCLCAFASKEMSASLPLAVLLYDRAFAAGSFKEAWRRRKGFYAALASAWALLAYLAVTSGTRGQTVLKVDGLTPLDYLQAQFVAVTRYLALAFWPDPLVFDYGMPKVGNFGAAAPAAALIAALLALTLYAVARNRKAGFCGALFFMVLAPSSSIIPIRETIFEYRAYLALSAVITLSLFGLMRAAAHLTHDAIRARRGVLAAALLTAPLLAALTHARNADYATETTLWRDTFAKRPFSARAALNLGVAEYQEGRHAEAETHLIRALALGDAAQTTYLTLGIAQLEQGKTGEALFNLARAAELSPDDSQANFEYGYALLLAGRAEQGRRHLRQAASSEGTTAEITLWIARKLMEEGFAEESRDYAVFARARAEKLGDGPRAAALAAFLAEREGAAR